LVFFINLRKNKQTLFASFSNQQQMHFYSDQSWSCFCRVWSTIFYLIMAEAPILVESFGWIFLPPSCCKFHDRHK